MLRFPKLILALFAGVLLSASTSHADSDPVRGKKLFKKCAACHTVGEDAKNKVGPHLNDVFGRTAGSIDGFKYSKAMKAAGDEGTVWTAETVDAFLVKPRKYMKGTKMTFAGFKKEADRTDVIAYLETFGAKPSAAVERAPETVSTPDVPGESQQTAAADTPMPTHGVFHLGRPATTQEIAAWDIDIRPDGKGLPQGRGTVADGEEIFAEQCAICHGDFGEGLDRWPVLAGGFDTLTDERPVKTIGSYWPYLSTVYDYVRRAMPFGDARSLSDDDVYAVTAYLLYLNDIVTDEDFELSSGNFDTVRLPNEENFFADDREEEAHYTKKGEPCMKDCKAEPARIVMRARVLDVTPEDEGEGGGAQID